MILSGQNILNAQEQPKEQYRDKINRSIYIEFLGASNFVGISYDSRIKPKSDWGYRIGFGYYYGMNSVFSNQYSNHGFTTPIEINYLLGRKRHKLELGFGVSLGIYSEKTSFYVNGWTPETAEILEKTTIQKKEFGYYLYSNIGYRYQAEKGFLFRVGVSPSFNFGDKYGIRKRPILYPYIGLGYSF